MNKFEEIAQEMKKDIEAIQNIAKEKMNLVDDEGRLKVKELSEKTIAAINSTIDKLRDVSSKVSDDEKVNELLNRANAKCKEAVEFTKTKISEIRNSDYQVNLDTILNDIRATFDKVMQSDGMQNAANFIKGLGEDINAFLNKPEVKDKIDRAKDATIAAAEKGLDVLKKSVEKSMNHQESDVENKEEEEPKQD